MTPKNKTVEIDIGDGFEDVAEHVAEPFHEGGIVPRGATVQMHGAGEWILPRDADVVDLAGLPADVAITGLKALKVVKGPVVVTAPMGRPLDEVVVGGHAYAGERVGSAWHFTSAALDMACRVAGWSTVDVQPDGDAALRVALS